MNLFLHFQSLPYGPNAWLLQAKEQTCKNESKSLLHRLHGHLEQQSYPNLKEFTLGYESILFEFHDSLNQQQFSDWLSSLSKVEKTFLHSINVKIISVEYNGPDLEDVARLSGLSVEEVISIHSSNEYTVRFLGFSPGFAYLDGLDTRLCLPRKDTPREKIAAGAVAIGGQHAGVYSIESPGGWHWLGNTKTPIFKVQQLDDFNEAFHFSLGDKVRFHPKS